MELQYRYGMFNSKLEREHNPNYQLEYNSFISKASK